MAEQELVDRADLLCRDLLRAIDDKTTLETFPARWHYVIRLILGLHKKFNNGEYPNEPPPQLLAFLRADILPRLNYILSHYTPPPCQDDVNVPLTVSTSGRDHGIMTES